VPAQPTVPEIASAAIRRFCDQKVPAEHRNELRVECQVRGRSVTIFERRPPWHPDLGSDWSRQPVAQLRYDPADHHWRLYHADRNSRWHGYDMVEPTTQLGKLLDEIDDDPTGIFWG
jgi:Protein of unknown function (DUF3024)